MRWMEIPLCMVVAFVRLFGGGICGLSEGGYTCCGVPTESNTPSIAYIQRIHPEFRSMIGRSEQVLSKTLAKTSRGRFSPLCDVH